MRALALAALVCVQGLAHAALAQQSASPPPSKPVITRSDPKIREVYLEVTCYSTKGPPPKQPNDGRTVSDLLVFRLTGIDVGIPVLTRTSWCDTDFTKLDARASFDAREFKLEPGQVFTRPKDGVEGVLRFDSSTTPRTFGECRFFATYMTQRWEVAVDERMAARSTWPREWPDWTKRYLGAEQWIDPTNEDLRKLAESATQGGPRSASPFLAAKAAVFAVLTKWKSMSGGSTELGPDRTLRGMLFTLDGEGGLAAGRGTEVELATTCVAAVRAIGIPSRVVYGLVTNKLQSGKTNTNFRYICEFYLPDIGWIPFDPVEMRGAGAATKRPIDPIKGFANVTDLENVLPLAVRPVPDGFKRADRYAAWGWNLGGDSFLDSRFAISRFRLQETGRGNGKPKTMPAPVTDQSP